MTVLVVDDDVVAGEGIKAILLREGYDVALAGNGRDAVDYLASQPPPDVILLDMLMPVMDGWQFLQARAATAPIVLMTGTILGLDWALAHGCAGCVRKPIDVSQLLNELRRVTAAKTA